MKIRKHLRQRREHERQGEALQETVALQLRLYTGAGRAAHGSSVCLQAIISIIIYLHYNYYYRLEPGMYGLVYYYIYLVLLVYIITVTCFDNCGTLKSNENYYKTKATTNTQGLQHKLWVASFLLGRYTYWSFH